LSKWVAAAGSPRVSARSAAARNVVTVRSSPSGRGGSNWGTTMAGAAPSGGGRGGGRGGGGARGEGGRAAGPRGGPRGGGGRRGGGPRVSGGARAPGWGGPAGGPPPLGRPAARPAASALGRRAPPRPWPASPRLHRVGRGAPGPRA